MIPTNWPLPDFGAKKRPLAAAAAAAAAEVVADDRRTPGELLSTARQPPRIFTGS